MRRNIGKRSDLWWSTLLLASFVGGVSAAESTSQPVTAITNVALFDSGKEQMMPPQTVVLVGDRIDAVGPAITIPSGAQVINGEGQFLIPGLIDAHVHLVHLSDRTHVTGEEFLPLFLAAGVTSVRSTGDAVAGEQRISSFAEQHRETCPQVFIASPLIDGDPPFHKDVGFALTHSEDVPKFVEEMKLAGVTTLKMYVGTRREIGQIVIAEAHRQGLVVTAHLGLYSAQDAVADGIDCLEHIWSVIDYIVPRGQTRVNVDFNNPAALKLVAAIKQGRVAVDPTLVVFRDMVILGDQPEYINHADNAKVPERMREGWGRLLKEREFQPETVDARREEFRKYQELTGILYRAGVTILAGTDAPEPSVCPGFSLHQELELLVESGLTPAAAINSASLNNARILKQDKTLGSIEPGKKADLVLLRQNPLDDIRNSRSIAKVVSAGHVVEPDEVLRAVPVK